MDKHQLTKKLKKEARRLGFEFVGITTPKPPAHFSLYNNWLAKNNHGEMHYLATDRARIRRANPKEILPECESILVLGMRYPHRDSPPPTGNTHRGQVASYAWGQDYHNIIPARLANLVDWLSAQSGLPAGQTIPNRYYTDTGPILERELAARAGLGWIGKNGCLINPKHGSYFFLAEIFLGVALVPDAPFESDHCGSCTRCLDACPTDCILPDRTLDATRCIAYYTIELKTAIPTNLRTPMGNWIFGCDICQDVCPWNIRFASPPEGDAYQPRGGIPTPSLTDELRLTPEEFNRKFKGNPIKRAKRRGYLRNVATALGNARHPQSVPALRDTLLHEPEPLVRAHAAWALGQIASTEAARALTDALATEVEGTVIVEIRAARSSLADNR